MKKSVSLLLKLWEYAWLMLVQINICVNIYFAELFCSIKWLNFKSMFLNGRTLTARKIQNCGPTNRFRMMFLFSEWTLFELFSRFMFINPCVQYILAARNYCYFSFVVPSTHNRNVSMTVKFGAGHHQAGKLEWEKRTSED